MWIFKAWKQTWTIGQQQGSHSGQALCSDADSLSSRTGVHKQRKAETHLYNACLVVCVLCQAAQCKCCHLLECKVCGGEHADEGWHTTALYNAGLVVCGTDRNSHSNTCVSRQETSCSPGFIGMSAQRLLQGQMPRAGVEMHSINTSGHGKGLFTGLPGPSSLGVCVANWPSNSAASR